MAYLCPHPCDGKTEYGYCRYTWCINPLHSNLGTAYQGQGVQKTIITNADRIRAMSDEELAKSMAPCGCPPIYFSKEGRLGDCPSGFEPCEADCMKCWFDWLRRAVET